MGLPKTLIEFAKKQAQTLVSRAERGTLVITAISPVISQQGVFIIKDEIDIEKLPNGLTNTVLGYIKRGLIGSVNKPNKIIVVIADTAENIIKKCSTLQFNYIVAPSDADSTQIGLFETFIKDMRDNKKIKVKAVLPNLASDYEGIVNFTGDEIKVGTTIYKTAEYCSRIAGLIVGTPLQESSTFKVLQEVEDIKRFDDVDTRIDNGEFVLIHDGTKVKVGRGVTSIKTITGTKNADMKYIKLMDTMDIMYSDLMLLINDNYIGRFPNDYNSKLNLMNAIDAYFEELARLKVISESYSINLDLEAIIKYLKDNNKYKDDMKEDALKKSNTGANVYLVAEVELLNSIEDVKITIYM